MRLRVIRTNGEIELTVTSKIDPMIQGGEIFAFCREDGWVVVGKDPIRKQQVPFKGIGRRWSDNGPR
ncbi:GSU3473 family protein [Geomesophilobacter sediminis]|uniref:Uncharacterized protein n=1 Tax=Geomesophilobacter sediminis TaxID=2798584 RepID=A0A8J7M0A4_9BACT|nr:hypothetical protein [Geomesophilobacter sediminis]MBJ6724152.1 hypothetical protein [Geomesophilobacter sediminis]